MNEKRSTLARQNLPRVGLRFYFACYTPKTIFYDRKTRYIYNTLCHSTEECGRYDIVDEMNVKYQAQVLNYCNSTQGSRCLGLWGWSHCRERQCQPPRIQVGFIRIIQSDKQRVARLIGVIDSSQDRGYCMVKSKRGKPSKASTASLVTIARRAP